MIAIVAALGAGACSFLANESDTHYRCDPAAPSCPSGEACSRDGYCEAPDLHPHGDGGPGSGSDPSTPDAEPELGQPDAAIAPDPPDAAPVTTTTITFGERPGTDHSGVTKDTFLVENDPTGTYGTDDAASFDADPLQNALIRFDLTATPAGAHVDQAELVLYIFDPLEDGDCVVAPVLQNWSEHDATWVFRDPSMDVWTTPGGTVGPEAVRFTPSAIGEYTIELPPALVQGWLDDATTNRGVRMVSTSTNGRGAQWYTRESSNDTMRPLFRLTIH